MDYAKVSLTELRTLLAEMDLPSSTPGLTGAERRNALAKRLQEARGDAPLPVTSSSNSSKEREAALSRYTMNELRRLCEEFSVSTVTAGLAGDARRTELARRIASAERKRAAAEHEDEVPVVGWGGSRRQAAAMDDNDDDEDDAGDDDDIDVGEEAAWSNDKPVSKPPALITPRQSTPYALSRSSPESPALQPSNHAGTSAMAASSITSNSADDLPPQSQRAPSARRRPPKDDYPYGGDASNHSRGNSNKDRDESLELSSQHDSSLSAASVPWLNIQQSQLPPRHASSSSSFSSLNTTTSPSSPFSDPTGAAAGAEAGSRPQTRDKPPPDTRTAREALAARLAQGSPMRKSSSGSMPGLSPHQRQPPPPSWQQHSQPRQASRQHDNSQRLDEDDGNGSCRSNSEEDDDDDYSVRSHSKDGSFRKEASGAPKTSAPIFRARPPPGDDYYRSQEDSPRSRSVNIGNTGDGGDGSSSGASSDGNALKHSEESSDRKVEAQPAAPMLPALGVQFFRELLTPRLSTEELSRRVRRTKRLLRELNDARASAISRRTRGDGADLPVLTAEMALRSVQEELKRVQGSVGLRSNSNNGSKGGKSVDEACSSLVNGGAVLPRTEVVYQLVALEAEARTAAESARATVARAEARDPDHGAEAELALGAQLAVLERALADAANEAEKERIERYHQQSAAAASGSSNSSRSSSSSNATRAQAGALTPRADESYNPERVRVRSGSMDRRIQGGSGLVALEANSNAGHDDDDDDKEAWQPPGGAPLMLMDPLNGHHHHEEEESLQTRENLRLQSKGDETNKENKEEAAGAKTHGEFASKGSSEVANRGAQGKGGKGSGKGGKVTGGGKGKGGISGSSGRRVQPVTEVGRLVKEALRAGDSALRAKQKLDRKATRSKKKARGSKGEVLLEEVNEDEDEGRPGEGGGGRGTDLGPSSSSFSSSVLSGGHVENLVAAAAALWRQALAEVQQKRSDEGNDDHGSNSSSRLGGARGPCEAEVLGHYATFLYRVEGNLIEAMATYEAAVVAAEREANAHVEASEARAASSSEASVPRESGLSGSGSSPRGRGDGVRSRASAFAFVFADFATFVQKEGVNPGASKKSVLPGLSKKSGEQDDDSSCDADSAAVTKAESLLLQGLAHDPTQPQLLGNYARLLANAKGDYFGAEQLYAQALDNAPHHIPTLLNYAQLLKKLGRLDPAEELLRRAIAPPPYNNGPSSNRSVDPARPQAFNNLANFLWRSRGDAVGAQVVYRQGLAETKASFSSGKCRSGGGRESLLQRNYAVFLQRNKELRPGGRRSSSSSGSAFPAGLSTRPTSAGVLEPLAEADNPLDEMATVEAAALQRAMAASRALKEPDSRKETLNDSSSESDQSSEAESNSDNEKFFREGGGTSYFEED